MNGLPVPNALCLNAGDYGYGIFYQDEKSQRAFENGLSKVDDKLNKAVSLSQLITMMRDIAYPATRMPKLLQQMLSEQNENLINMVFIAMFSAKSLFIPNELAADFMKETATAFLTKAAHEQENASLQAFCLDKALNFIFDKDNLKSCATWILEDQVTIDGVKLNSKLTVDHKYAIIKSVYNSRDFSDDEKKKLHDKVFAEDTTDRASKV